MTPEDELGLVERCGTCRFWRRVSPRQDDDSGVGGEVSDCVRYPPVPLSAGSRQRFPETRHKDWCGEYDERERSMPRVGVADPEIMAVIKKYLSTRESAS